MKYTAIKSLLLTVTIICLPLPAFAKNNHDLDIHRPNNISDQKWANLKSAVQEEKLIPSPSGIGGQYASFGNSISVDGNRVLIGAPRYHFDAVTNPQGAATVMEYNETTETWVETATLMAIDGMPENNFGVSVSLSGNRALIGAHWDNDSGFTRSGAAYIFDYDANTNSWSQSQKITASDLRSNDFFGYSVSLSGDRALIGSFGDNGRKGSAYVFDLDSQSNNWVESQKLLASDGAANDFFGFSVSLSGDRALIGAYGDTGRLGSAYVFDLDSHANNWLESKKILASDGAVDDEFGYSVSLSNDRLLIGATGDNSAGSAYIFDYILDNNTNTSIWTETHKLIPDDLNTLSFGSAVSISGNKALIGAKDYRHPGNVFFQTEGAAFVFELDTNTDTWVKTPVLTSDDALPGDNFGTSVSLSSDWVMVGAPWNNSQGNYSGSAYFFKSINSPFGVLWQQNQKLRPTTGSSYDQFGYSVSLSGDRALIGAYEDGFRIDDNFSRSYSGSAYIFDFDNNSNNWVLTQKLTPNEIVVDAEFGKSVSLSGNRALIGAHKDEELGSERGAAYIFDLDVNTNTWSQTQKLLPDADSGSQFGVSVSLSGDRALVGMVRGTGLVGRTGNAYVFELNSNTNSWSKSQILFADDGTSFRNFGSAVSLLADRAVIGATAARNNSNVSSGAVYVFDFDTNNDTWLQSIKLLADDGSSDDGFGNSVSQTQDRILIGARADDDMGSNSGSAYVFKYSEIIPNWMQEQKFVPADGAANDYFGRSVSLLGNRALIGAGSWNLSTNNITSPGSAYVFDLDTNTDNWSQSQKLTASDGLGNDAFGVSVSLSGDKVLIGASLNDGNGIESGAAYVLNLDTYDVSVNVTGLAPGNSLELLNNGGDNIIVNTDSVATFPTPVINGRGYNVTIKSPQPTTPAQICVVSNPMGTINGSDIELAVTCTTIKYDIDVTVTGLDANNSIELTTNGQSLNFTGDGVQSFVGIDDETDYAVLLTAQPTSPNQTCSITGGNSGDNDGSGTINGESVEITVNCVTTKYDISVTVTGLDMNNSIELTANSQSLIFTDNSSMNFAMPVDDGSAYAVFLTAQPTNPNQICVITGGNSGDNDGSGTVAGQTVQITVTCTINDFFIGGEVTGLAAGNSVTLDLNSAYEQLHINSNGAFAFVNPLIGESQYIITIENQPTSPSQTCVVINGTGQINASDIDDVRIICTDDLFFIGGSVTGLGGGFSLLLRNNNEDEMTVVSSGVFVFNTPLADLQSYEVSMQILPSSTARDCVLNNNSGIIAGDDIDDVVITCNFVHDLIFQHGFE